MKSSSNLPRLALAVLAIGTFGTIVWLSAGIGDPAKQAPNPPSGGGKTWTMYGGTVQRNMVNLIDRNIPATWQVPNPRKMQPGQGIKWAAELGSQSYGNPVIGGGKIFLGTNNNNPRNPRDTALNDGRKEPVDKGVLMCFEEATGKFLWQAVHDKLPIGRVQDWPEQGICSSPFVEGDRVYYVSNRA